MNKKQIKRIYNVVIIAALVVFIGLVCSRFVHWGNVEYTDDAQVWRHITPINARVGGFIKEVRFDDYQHVKKGDTLVIIEDAEFRLALAQAEAHLRGSKEWFVGSNCRYEHHSLECACSIGRHRRSPCTDGKCREGLSAV